MLGPHMQKPVNDWDKCLPLLPAGTWVKAVNNQGVPITVKQTNDKLNTVFRYEDTVNQHPSTDFEANKEIARRFFPKFIDGTFFNNSHYLYINAIEEWNEYLANSQTEAERLMWLSWCEAVNWVWVNEYQTDTRLRHIKLVSCNTAIGNDIDPRFAQIVDDYGGILGYHGYIKVYKGVVDSGDWQYHSGRFASMDQQFLNQGIKVDWLGTEGGAYLGVYDGWKHEDVYGGSREKYINGALTHRLTHLIEWNNQNGRRWLSDCLFTSGGGDRWGYYELSGDDLIAIAEFQQNFIPPGGNMDWKNELWDQSVQEQIDRGIPLNPDAGLQQMIVKHSGNYTPVHRERTVTTSDGVKRGFMAGESITGSGPRLIWAFPYPWDPSKVEVFPDPKV